MAIKDITYQYSTTGSRSRACGVFFSFVITCNKDRCRIISDFLYLALPKFARHLFEIAERFCETRRSINSITHEIKNMNKMACGWRQQKNHFDFRLKDVNFSPKISTCQVLDLQTSCASLWPSLSLLCKITDILVASQGY